MDKNSIIGFSLIAALLIGFSYYSQPSKEQQAQNAKNDSIQKAAQQRLERQQRDVAANKGSEKLAAINDTTGLFYTSKIGTNKQVVLKSNKVILTFDTHGGTVSKAEIIGFKNNRGDGKNITLFDGKDQKMKFMLAGKSENIITDELFFEPTNVTDSTVTMTAKAKNGGTLNIDYKLHNDYLVDMNVSVKGLDGVFAPNYDNIDIQWTDKVRQQEKGFTFENRYSTLTYKKNDGGTDYLNETKVLNDEPCEKAIDWVAFKNQFFSCVLISKTQFAANSLLTSVPLQKGTNYLKQYGVKLKTNFDPTGKQATQMVMFFGPNKFRLLQNMDNISGINKDLNMEQLVYLGWPLFRIINRWFTIYVFDWLTNLNINMGIVLLIITLILKVITYPLVKKSYMSSAKMRVLKPKVEEQTKDLNGPDDSMKKQQETMSIYSKYGVSPLSGCMPMLIQMPIWIAMFNFVPNAIELRGESFLWIKDLSTYDPILEWGTNIWGIGDHLSLTCILFCIANVLYSVMSMRQQKDQMVGNQGQQMKMMQWMMYLMPVMFFFMFNDYSSGLNYYYFISLFFSAAIMWVLRKTTNDEKLLSILESRYKENDKNPKKASGMAARLSALQKQQEEMQRQRGDLNKKKKDFFDKNKGK
jgi:YidC/Oxa1 family membrane protein insertase